MKVRQSFVSNSSSSSYIVDRHYFPTIWDLAIAMIALRDYREHYTNNHFDFDDHYDALDINKCLEYKKDNLQKLGITFPTTNFDTFIYDMTGTYWVSTCNNHPFYILFHNKTIPIVGNKIRNGETWTLSDYLEFFFPRDYKFFDIRSGKDL